MAEAAFDPVGFMGPQIFGLPVNRDILFANHKDIYKKRIEKRQRKLIVKISFLNRFLRKGEQILLITTGYSPLNSAAQYLTGYLFVYLKRSLIVFTNYRILHIPTTADYDYNNSIAQVAYAGCHSIELKGGTLVVQYGQAGRRKKEKFTAIAGPERRKIRALLKKNIPLSGTKSQLATRIHLCPRCTHMLAKGSRKCEKCQLQFKRKLVAAVMALFIPGGGYFYIRQYLLGFLTALSEIALLVFISYAINDLHLQAPVDPLHLSAIPAYLYLKLAATIHSGHFINDFLPRRKKIEVRKAGTAV
jgi:hypothetical protein